MRSGGRAAWLSVALCAVAAACTNGGGLSSVGGGGGGGSPSPFPQSSAIGLGVPNQKIGVENDPVWGTVGGYTQTKNSQVLAFPPGAQITIENLSNKDPHTLNVIATVSSPPVKWPQNPSLSFYPSGNGILGAGYASGSLNPGDSVTVTLKDPGIYLIGCAYHYVEFNMRDVIQVVAGATPGPTASPGPGGYAIVRKSRAAAAQERRPQLVDQHGRAFTLGSLVGKPVAVTFVGAHCTDACPLINAQFSDAASKIAHGHINGRLLTITLDPEHDSPAAMREIARRFGADPRYWILAGGPVRDVHAIMKEFGVIAVQGRDGYRDEHTTFVSVLDARGRLSQTMLASSALSDAIVDALKDERMAQR